MTNEKLIAHQTKREAIEKEFDAIEAGAFAIVMMLRKLKGVAVELHHSTIHEMPPDSLETLVRLRDGDVEELTRCRIILGQMLEDVGDFVDGGDMVDELTGNLTEPVYGLFHSFPKVAEDVK